MARFAEQDQADSSHSSGGVVFVGSSSIRLWTSLAADFPDAHVINRGFGGAETADCVEHFDRLITPHAPSLVVFYAGSNDLAAGKSPAEVAANFERFCARLHASEPTARILFLSIVPAPARWKLRDQVMEANRLIAAHCARDIRRSFVDVASGLLGESGAPREEFFVADRLHLAPQGYAIWRHVLSAMLMPANAGRAGGGGAGAALR